LYETFEHTADLGLRVHSGSLEELLAEAAQGLFAMIVNLAAVRPVEAVTFELEGDAPDYLLFDWLNELIYTYETRHYLFSQFEVRLTESGLRATARGEPVDPERHALEHEVKAITYHGLKVAQQDGAWLAEVIVDI
jgi:SHS2 domain-containing protein